MPQGKRSKAKKEKCPECDRLTVEIHHYLSGDILYVHTKKLVKEPFPHYDITDSCFVPAGEEVNHA